MTQIKLLLCISGYEQKDIQFDVVHGTGQRFVRVGYWSFMEQEALQRIQNNINVSLVPTSFWDDDCGWKTSYHIIIEKGD